MISSTRYPTANIYFPKICQIKLALSQWMNFSNEFIKRMAEKMMFKSERYWSVIHDIMGLLQFWILDYLIINKIKYIVEALLLINKTITNDEHLDEYDVFIDRMRETRSSSIKTELDHYLEYYIIKMTPDFDILNWWKTNGIIYSTLQTIAKDLLNILISSVTSESTFSTTIANS
ncbi:hypothetical protein Lal_00018800 [Lupinus albus]|nr:hypothetical protein Lal_00018800 [Lupinus albus]